MVIGDKLKTECITCDAEEIWEIESITDEEYSDGVFKTYKLKAIKNCLFPGVRRSVKDVPECMRRYELVKS